MPAVTPHDPARDRNSPGRTPRVAVVIPSYQAGSALLDSLRSVADSRPAPAWTIVVDNASSDSSIRDARRQFPEVEYILNRENRGFGQACNQGIERAVDLGASWVLLLNQDACLGPDTLASMVSLAECEPRAGAIGCQTHAPGADGSAASLLYAGAWKTALPLWQRIPGVGTPSHAPLGTTCRVDYVWGHAMLLRAAALHDVGAFDPGFFMYYEDLDLCDRLQRGGWENWSDNRVVVWHAIEDAGRSKRSELWRCQMKQESMRVFCLRRLRWPVSDLVWLATAFREAVHLAGNARWRALGHLLVAVLHVARGAPSARPPRPSPADAD